MSKEAIDRLVRLVSSSLYEFEIYTSGVRDFFLRHPLLASGDLPTVHSVKWRIKDTEHLREKIGRKLEEGRKITDENIFSEITDIGGVRVLHLHQQQLEDIHKAIVLRRDNNDWVFAEDPKAYTWDPESVRFMEKLGIRVMQKESFYTSVHYVVKPRVDSVVSCEIQVRTLFEEIWGEVDHHLNYPAETESVACREQIRVLAKVVGAGSRVVDAVFRVALDEKLRGSSNQQRRV